MWHFSDFEIQINLFFIVAYNTFYVFKNTEISFNKI